MLCSPVPSTVFQAVPRVEVVHHALEGCLHRRGRGLAEEAGLFVPDGRGNATGARPDGKAPRRVGLQEREAKALNALLLLPPPLRERRWVAYLYAPRPCKNNRDQERVGSVIFQSARVLSRVH